MGVRQDRINCSRSLTLFRAFYLLYCKLDFTQLCHLKIHHIASSRTEIPIAFFKLKLIFINVQTAFGGNWFFGLVIVLIATCDFQNKNYQQIFTSSLRCSVKITKLFWQSLLVLAACKRARTTTLPISAVKV